MTKKRKGGRATAPRLREAVQRPQERRDCLRCGVSYPYRRRPGWPAVVYCPRCVRWADQVAWEAHRRSSDAEMTWHPESRMRSSTYPVWFVTPGYAWGSRERLLAAIEEFEAAHGLVG